MLFLWTHNKSMCSSLCIFLYLFSPSSNCSLNPLNCSDISSCHKERTITHTPPNQDGRATPSPEHVSTADCEDLHNFDDYHSSVPGDNFITTESTNSPTATNNAKNTKEAEQTDENFNSFHYWRAPLPDISEDLEMLSCPGSVQIMAKEGEKEANDEEQEENCSDSNSSHGKATSDQIQKVLDCLQPHIDDPDVQGKHIEPGRMVTVLGLCYRLLVDYVIFYTLF